MLQLQTGLGAHDAALRTNYAAGVWEAQGQHVAVACSVRDNFPWHINIITYRVDGHLVDLGFVCFLTRYCFVCHIPLGQVEIRQNEQITLAAMVETTKSCQQRIV